MANLKLVSFGCIYAKMHGMCVLSSVVENCIKINAFKINFFLLHLINIHEESFMSLALLNNFKNDMNFLI